MKNIILASASERRSRILSECGIRHEVIKTEIEEIMDRDMDISDIVRINAERKAEAAAAAKEGVIIGADTLVIHNDNIIGKPKDEEEAKTMLRGFSEGEIDVYTGLCVIKGDKKVSGFEKSALKVISLNDEKVEKLFKLLAPYDKAGGFSIEGVGSLIFDNINGSYFNILGLPMIKLSELFGEVGLDLADYIE
ncbi:MAG: Maf family nucleotide pyrophosphatase [Candidatus Omnitrophota bacterium]